MPEMQCIRVMDFGEIDRQSANLMAWSLINIDLTMNRMKLHYAKKRLRRGSKAN